MVTGVDVEVLGRHDVPVAGFAGQVVVDGGGQRAAAGYRQRATRAEVVLEVDDDQRSHALHHILGLFARPPGNPPAMLIRRIARPLLSAVFVGQGVDSLLNPKRAAEAAAPAVDGLRALPDPVGSAVPSDPQTFAQITAAAQIGGGVVLAS